MTSTRKFVKYWSEAMRYFQDHMPHVFDTITEYVGEDICIDLYLKTGDQRYLDHVPDLDLTFMKKGQLRNVVSCFGGGAEFMQFYRLQSAVVGITGKRDMCGHVIQLLENIEKETCPLLSQDVYCAKFEDRTYAYPEDFLSSKFKVSLDDDTDEYGVGGIIKRVNRFFFNYKDKRVITRIFFEISNDQTFGRKIFPEVDEDESLSFRYVRLKSNVRLANRKQTNPLLYRVYSGHKFQRNVRPYHKRPTFHHWPNGVYRSLKKIDFRNGFDDPRFRSKDDRIYIHVWPRVVYDKQNYYTSFELSNELSAEMTHPGTDDEYSDSEEEDEHSGSGEEVKSCPERVKRYPSLSTMFTDEAEAAADTMRAKKNLCSYNNTGRRGHDSCFSFFQFCIRVTIYPVARYLDYEPYGDPSDQNEIGMGDYRPGAKRKRKLFDIYQ